MFDVDDACGMRTRRVHVWVFRSRTISSFYHHIHTYNSNSNFTANSQRKTNQQLYTLIYHHHHHHHSAHTQNGLHHQGINGLPEAKLSRQQRSPSRESRHTSKPTPISKLLANVASHPQSDTTRFSKITDMKRSPTNDNATARRASWEEQTIPRGAGVLGDMWNR